MQLGVMRRTPLHLRYLCATAFSPLRSLEASSCVPSLAAYSSLRPTEGLGGRPTAASGTKKSIFYYDFGDEERRHVGFKNEQAFENWKRNGGIKGLISKPDNEEYVDFDDIVDGNTYHVDFPQLHKAVVSVRQDLSHQSQAQEEEFARAVVLYAQGSRRPEMRIIKELGGRTVTELDLVVVAPDRIFIGSHKRFVRDVSAVYEIAQHANVIEIESAAGNPMYMAFAGKRIVAAFLAEACSSEDVNARVTTACQTTGVLRFVRNGSAISIQEQ